MEMFVPGMPGMRTEVKATPQIIFKQNLWEYLAGGKIIDGTNSADPFNGTDTNVLQPGTLMGKITSSGLYAPTILGVTAGAYTSGGTSITVSAASAAEIVRRVGTSGTLNFIGPPSAGGTNAVIAQSFSAVNTSTGVLTITSLGANLVAGSIVAANDGTQTPVTLIPDGYGIIVTASDNVTRELTPFPRFPIAGVIIASSIINYSGMDTSLQAWVRTNLSTLSGGKFIIDDQF